MVFLLVVDGSGGLGGCFLGNDGRWSVEVVVIGSIGDGDFFFF